jgi:hypothetical protein
MGKACRFCNTKSESIYTSHTQTVYLIQFPLQSIPFLFLKVIKEDQRMPYRFPLALWIGRDGLQELFVES